jgi:hypothetical protein
VAEHQFSATFANFWLVHCDAHFLPGFADARCGIDRASRYATRTTDIHSHSSRPGELDFFRKDSRFRREIHAAREVPNLLEGSGNRLRAKVREHRKGYQGGYANLGEPTF